MACHNLIRKNSTKIILEKYSNEYQDISEIFNVIKQLMTDHSIAFDITGNIR